MRLLLKLVIFNLLIISGHCSGTTCQDSQKHFAKLCFAPKPINDVDFAWLTTRQAMTGLHGILGNDIMRLHRAETLKGKLLSLRHNFDDICLRSTVLEGDFNSTVYGHIYGFGNLHTKWECNFSKDFPQLFVCDDVNPDDTKYHENFNSYISYTDHNNYVVEVHCFPNGEVGWLASAINSSLTEAEKRTIINHITSLGFSNETTVTMYDAKFCAPDIQRLSYPWSNWVVAHGMVLETTSP